MNGKLMIVGTPIGNLEDMSIRGLKALETADLIAAEDTRRSIKLLNHFKIRKKLTAYHQHNEQQSAGKLIVLLSEGQNIALITDAGMPLISDPGAVLVRQCVKLGIEIEVIPGPNAGLCGLVLSGLDVREYLFLGFLGKEKKAIDRGVEKITKSEVTVVLYESPHRLSKMLEILVNKGLGHRQMSISREITKIYEETRYGIIKEHAEFYKENEPQGEFVMCIEGKTQEEILAHHDIGLCALSPREHLDHLIKMGLNEKEAMKQVARERGVSKREIYNEVKRQKVLAISKS